MTIDSSVKNITTSIVPKQRMFFGERSFGIFFVLWGLILIASQSVSVSTVRHGVFFSYLEQYMSGRCWGVLLLTIGIARWVAFKFNSQFWRVNLSLMSFILVAIVASISVYTRLWSATAPLAIFVTYIAFWCHRSLVRDLR